MSRKWMPIIPRHQAVDLYRDGEPMTHLARRYGVSTGWLTARFREWGEPVRGYSEAQRLRRARERGDGPP